MKLDKVILAITLRDVVREAVVFGVCLILAFGMNIYAVWHYQTEWSELYTNVGYTIVLAAIIYAARCVFKCLAMVACRVVCKIRKCKQKA